MKLKSTKQPAKQTSEKNQNQDIQKDTLIYGKAYKFDQYDRKILQELDQNARKTLAQLSPKVGLSRDAIRNRIQKMINAKVIINFKPIYNSANMGYPIINYVFIALYNPTEAREKQFITYLKSNKHVTYIASLIGKWDYILDIMAANPGEFDRILKDIRHTFSELIKDYEVCGVMQEYEYEQIGKLAYN